MNQREIKFRAYHEEEGMMLTVNGIILDETLDGAKMPGYVVHAEPVPEFQEMIEMNARYEDVYASPLEKVRLMQYTGLKDKNGKEIYEGDVVKVMCDDDEESAVTQEVKWSKWGGYFCEEEMAGDYLPALGNPELTIEVIGNIFENPELL